MIPVLGRFPREENDNPLQYFCLENPMDRGASLATVQVTESDTTEQLTLSHLGQAIGVHTKEDVEIYQICTVNQSNKNDWPKETWKKCPIKVTQTAMRVQLRDSPSEFTCVSIPCTILFPF